MLSVICTTLLLVTSLLPEEAYADCNRDDPCFDGAYDQELEFPITHTASNDNSKLVELDLVVAPLDITYDWLTWTTRAFNGAVPGPTIMVKPGDQLKIHLYNELPANPDDIASLEDKSEMRLQNSVNLHTHGLHVSSIAPADDVLNIQVHPGFEFHYEYSIVDSQTPGSFWYHPHFKGPATLQVRKSTTTLLLLV